MKKESKYLPGKLESIVKFFQCSIVYLVIEDFFKRQITGFCVMLLLCYNQEMFVET